MAASVGDNMFYKCAAAPDGRTIFVGDSAGVVHVLRMEEGLEGGGEERRSGEDGTVPLKPLFPWL